MEIKINSFEDVCKYQRILDEEIGKVRNNGFVPKERDLNKMKLSIIAECIEFNEELEETHKTWKQKEIKKEKQLEELTDIMFFIAQMLNCVGYKTYTDIEEGFGYEYDVNETILDFIYFVVKEENEVYIGREIQYMYGKLINSAGFSLNDVYEEYERKWKINMTRINKDWTIGSGKND
ncbi:MAG: dUTP diphosphatase [Aeromonas sp.]